MITPSGLHFERHHNGVPDIDPARHRLLIHGMVKRPLIFTVDAIIGENDEMNAQTLPKVKMPNRSNFIVVYPSRGK